MKKIATAMNPPCKSRRKNGSAKGKGTSKDVSGIPKPWNPWAVNTRKHAIPRKPYYQSQFFKKFGDGIHQPTGYLFSVVWECSLCRTGLVSRWWWAASAPLCHAGRPELPPSQVGIVEQFRLREGGSKNPASQPCRPCCVTQKRFNGNRTIGSGTEPNFDDPKIAEA